MSPGTAGGNGALSKGAWSQYASSKTWKEEEAGKWQQVSTCDIKVVVSTYLVDARGGGPGGRVHVGRGAQGLGAHAPPVQVGGDGVVGRRGGGGGAGGSTRGAHEC